MTFDDEAGFDTTDPKHPRFAEVSADWADFHRKWARENPPAHPFIEDRDLGDEDDAKEAA